MPNVNLLGVLIAAVVGMAIGALWYGPLFGKKWMKLTGFTKEDMSEVSKAAMAQKYAIGFVGQLATAYLLSILIAATFQYFGGFSYQPILWLWAGLVIPVSLNGVLWEDEPWGLLLLNSSYHLAQLLAMGAILSYIG